MPQITQCPILSHTTFRYTVKANNAGTHWWHSHVGVQRADGAFGALIIREPQILLPPQIRNAFDYDLIDHVMLLQDWDPRPGTSMFTAFHHSVDNNKPSNILINGKGRYFELTDTVERPIETTARPTTTSTAAATATALLPTHPAATTTTTNPAPTTTNPATTPSNDVSNNTISPTEAVDSASHPKTATNEISDNRDKRATSDTLPSSSIMPYALFQVQNGSRYRFRTINSGFLNCPLVISIDNHTLLVIASDGHYIEPVVVDSLVSYAGERFDFVVTADQPVANYWIRVKGLIDCDERNKKAHQAAILRYEGAGDGLPAGQISYAYQRGGFQMNSLNRGTGHVDSLAIVETTALEPDTPELLADKTDFQFYVFYDFYDKDFPQFNHPRLYPNAEVSDNSSRFFGPQLNHISMTMPSMPFLVGRERNDEAKYCNASSLLERGINCQKDFCECTHVYQVPVNATVEVIIIDEGYKYDANHPFHLHGHDFRVVAMERVDRAGVSLEQIQHLDATNAIKRRLSGAPIKDTVTVPDGGYTIIRFVANNPGFWLFHCHIDFHAEVGMALVFKVGDYHQMPRLPRDFPKCANFMPPMGESGPSGAAMATATPSHPLSISIFAAGIMFASLSVRSIL